MKYMQELSRKTGDDPPVYAKLPDFRELSMWKDRATTLVTALIQLADRDIMQAYSDHGPPDNLLR
jgi:hypothetical protein